MRNILITGGSRGIGAATVKLFCKKGDRVFFTYKKNIEKAQAICKNFGAFSYRLDQSHEDEVTAMVKDITKSYGPVSILINNAGFSAGQTLFTDISLSQWNQTFSNNVTAMFLTAKAVAPFMISEKKGKIINLSSIWGITGGSCEVDYSAAKAAVIGFTKALAKELGPSGIQVNCVAPGVIDTDMNTHLTEEDFSLLKEETPLMRIGTPEEIAALLYFLSSDQADFITGQVISPNGGILV